MSRNEDFDNGIWSDPVFEELSDAAAWLYIWSWTNPRCDMAGIYRVGKRAMTESRVHLDAIDSALDELASAHFVYYEQGVLWVRTRVARLRSKQERMAIGVARDFVKQAPPEHPFHRRWLDHYGDHAWLRGALREVLRNLTGTSHEVHVSAYGTGDHEKLSSTSIEVLNDRALSESGSRTTSNVPPRASGKVDPLVLPVDLPAEIAVHVDPVLAVLQQVHGERGGNVPMPRALALVLMRFPDRDFLAVAHELRYWATVGPGAKRNPKDWTRQYAAFLGQAEPSTPSRPGDVPATPRATPPVANSGDLSRFDRQPLRVAQ